MVMDAIPLSRPDPRPVLRREEAAALVLALAAHAGLIAWLTLKPPTPALLPMPERMMVTMSDQTADTSTSPDPNAQAAPVIASVIAENPVPDPAPAPLPQPAPAQQRQPVPKPVAKIIPPRPQPQPAKAQPAKVAPAPAKSAAKPSTRPAGGGSRIGDDFLRGVPGGQTPGARSAVPSAQAIGPTRAQLSGAITRQLRPRWAAPQGADADHLVTVLTWDMNPDGSLAGSPRVVSQSGITDANRAQAQRHAEQAIRAVRLAAPFDLPSDLYAAWKHVVSFSFDRKLSQ